jgi:hypothetical protein
LFRKLERIETEAGRFCPKTTPESIKLGADVVPLQQIDTHVGATGQLTLRFN